MAEGDVELGHVDYVAETLHRLLNYEEESQDISKQHQGSIYKVPNVYRDISPSSFTPRVVSIGPLHHNDERLRGFEVQKTTYMHNLFHNVLGSLDSTPVQLLKECVMRVSGSIDRIKSCYIGMRAYSDSELVDMMVRDACFILAFLYKPARRPPINIIFDMVLIENQIPFFVLQDIFDCTLLKLHPELSLANFISIIKLVCNIFEGDLEMGDSSISSSHKHILDFLHKSYRNPYYDSSTLHEYPKAHSVIELDRSGVRFSNNPDAKWPMAMELEISRFACFPLPWNKPTLKMPVLRLFDGIESIIKNLIIYENSADVQTCVASYMYAMDMLIDTPEDITRLVKSKVIVNRLGSDEKAADLINNMLVGVRTEDFYYQDEWKKMDGYYSVAAYRKVQTDFIRKYFSNPWSAIALLAGIVLFVLTVVQTVYSVKDSKDA